MEEGENMKSGTYDWIVDFDAIETSLIDTLLTLGQQQQQLKQNYVFENSLIVGCGTSQVPQILVERGLMKFRNVGNASDPTAQTYIHFEHVVSVDILEDCIRHMIAQESSTGNNDTNYIRKRLTWLQCDMLDAEQIYYLIQSGRMPSSYDFIFDKGTFDAILVEGVVHQYVINVYNLLKPSVGIFCMVSVHNEDFLSPFLSSPLFNFHVVYSALPNGKTGCIAVCVRKSSQLLDELAIATLEENVMNNYFKEQSPLFSQQDIDAIMHKFNCGVGQNNSFEESDNYYGCQQQRVSLHIAYDLLFGDKPELGYSYSLFLEDIHNFQLVEEGSMSAEEAVAFVKSME